VLRAQLLREMGASPVVEGVTVNELWMKPSRRHPEGIYYVWTGSEELVPKQRFPYAHGKLPFTQIGQIPRPGSQHYHSAVKYLRSPQMELNKYHAQRIVNREAFANIKWWIDSQLELEARPRRLAAADPARQLAGRPAEARDPPGQRPSRTTATASGSARR
jgi:hypothetical protein